MVRGVSGFALSVWELLFVSAVMQMGLALPVGVVPPSQALETVIATARALGVKVVRHWEGDEFNFGGTTVGVLFPPRDWPVGHKATKQ